MPRAAQPGRPCLIGASPFCCKQKLYQLLWYTRGAPLATEHNGYVHPNNIRRWELRDGERRPVPAAGRKTRPRATAAFATGRRMHTLFCLVAKP